MFKADSLMQMAPLTKEDYTKLLTTRAKISTPNQIVEGIILCPKGWYEVKIKRQKK